VCSNHESLPGTQEWEVEVGGGEMLDVGAHENFQKRWREIMKSLDEGDVEVSWGKALLLTPHWSFIISGDAHQ
jgi:hypothetical protein